MIPGAELTPLGEEIMLARRNDQGLQKDSAPQQEEEMCSEKGFGFCESFRIIDH